MTHGAHAGDVTVLQVVVLLWLLGWLLPTITVVASGPANSCVDGKPMDA